MRDCSMHVLESLLLLYTSRCDTVVCTSVRVILLSACSSVRLCCLCTGVGRNNGNTTDTIHIPLLRWCSTTLASVRPQSFLEWTRTSFEQSLAEFWSRDSAVGIVTGYGLDYRRVGIQVPVGSRIFSTSSRPALGGTHPPIQWYRGLFPRG
jgi:hypothetical protein